MPPCPAILGAAVFMASIGSSAAHTIGASSGAAGRLAQSPLPRCVLTSSFRLTPQGPMRCSYQCGDRIVVRSGYTSCPSSAPRPGRS
ncbi:hypothetical protein EV668_3585 [Enterovirga rhinocerotis]|uniref:Uncharacterized protein n=1 Tax=Enterovirga rhinocerotis TaxID=1339210 RepID=A0A4R7BTP8_9HYPH|nr:hypothetical protein EV668_3585 [Enterovirga rhinocerotis]